MTKAQLARAIARDSNMSEEDALLFLESFMKVVKSTLIKGKNIYLRGFVSLILKKRAEKIGRNITKNTFVKISAHYEPVCKFVRSFRNELKEARTQKLLSPETSKEFISKNFVEQ